MDQRDVALAHEPRQGARVVPDPARERQRARAAHARPPHDRQRVDEHVGARLAQVVGERAGMREHDERPEALAVQPAS